MALERTCLITKIFDGVEYGLHVIGTFCDLCKAFDCASPNILRDKLGYYGIKGTALELVMKFLKDKKLFVM